MMISYYAENISAKYLHRMVAHANLGLSWFSLG